MIIWICGAGVRIGEIMLAEHGEGHRVGTISTGGFPSPTKQILSDQTFSRGRRWPPCLPADVGLPTFSAVPLNWPMEMGRWHWRSDVMHPQTSSPFSSRSATSSGTWKRSHRSTGLFCFCFFNGKPRIQTALCAGPASFENEGRWAWLAARG